MIHITIPTFRTLTDKRESYKKFTAFDIHVNGAYHASVRYSALYSLHEKLVEAFGFRLNVPEFPPKKIWFSVDNRLINERREALADYFQGVIQNPDISKHMILEKAFLQFQVDSFAPTVSLIKLDAFLPDGRPTPVNCYSDDSTNSVMMKFCEVAEINVKNATHFGLFLCRSRNGKDIAGCPGPSTSSTNTFDQLCVRWLKNFESPFISQQIANNENGEAGIVYRIVVRRVTWDPSVEEPLMDDPGCLKIFFLQALSDIHCGIMRLPQDVKENLNQLQAEGSFRQFIRMCHQHPSYGYELLAPVISDFPRENTKCQLKVGRRQLVLEYDENGICMQTFLRSTRIRVWRVSHTDSQQSVTAATAEMTFQIEYLVGKNEFGVITLNTLQAVLLSLFLQSIAAEILHDQPNCNSPTFKFDDSVSAKAIENLEVSKANSIVGDDLNIKECESGCNGMSRNDSVQKLLMTISYQMPFDNDTFEDITDNDL